jgi:hypothetical protein
MKLGSNPRDWQPFTFRGVVALALGPLGRLARVQLLAAFWVVGSLSWFIGAQWWPVVDQAGEELPDQAGIRRQTLVWHGPVSARLAENPFLAITVNLEGTSARTSTSDLQLELVRDGLRLHSLLGYLYVPYPRGYVVQLDRTPFQAWWGAWRWPLLALIALASLLLVLAVWHLLGLCYSTYVWLFSFYADRAATPMACWKLASAAQLPSSVLLGASIFLYGMHRLDLVGLMLAAALLLAIGWVYLLISPFWLPLAPAASPRNRNPFRKKVRIRVPRGPDSR